MQAYISKELLNVLIHEVTIELLYKELEKMPQSLYLPKNMLQCTLDEALNAPDLAFKNIEGSNARPTTLLYIFLFNIALSAYYMNREMLITSAMLCLLCVPTVVIAQLFNDPDINFQLKKIIQQSLIVNEKIDHIHQFLVNNIPEEATDLEVKNAIKKYIIKYPSIAKLSRIFEEKGVRSLATSWYLSGVWISFNTASDHSVNIVIKTIKNAIENKSYEEQQENKAIELLAHIEKITNNKDKIAKCLEFKLGDQWVELQEIMNDSLMFNDLILDPVYTVTGHTYDREGIEGYLCRRNLNTQGYEQLSLDPNSGLSLNDKSLKPNIAVAGLLAYLILSDHDVKVSNYPGFLDPKTSKRFLDPVLTLEGQTINSVSGINLPKNIQLKQLMEAFPYKKLMARPRINSI